MADIREQRAALKFCFLLGRNASDAVDMLSTAYKEHALKRTQVYEWYLRFKRGDMSIEDIERPGRPSTSRTDENVEIICALVYEDRRRTIDELAEISGLSWSSVQRILAEDLQMRRIAAKFISRLLTPDQKAARVAAYRDLLDHLEVDENFFDKIITGDESWCYGYDPEKKQQSSQWKAANSPHPKKARQVKSVVKTMLICFFDVRSIVHSEYVPEHQTVNQVFYLSV